MKRFVFTVCLMFSVMLFGASVFAQRVETEGELFNKISKLTQTKKADDQAKAYQLSKIFLQKFGKGDSAEVKKIKDFVANYEMVALGKLVDEGKTAEAFAFGKQMLAVNPDNADATMLLAYAGYQALIKKQDQSFSADSMIYTKKTLQLIGDNKPPKNFAPFADKAETTAMMYYITGSFLIDSALPEAANNFYKSVQTESKVKNSAYPYYIIAFNYEKKFEKATMDFDAKHGKKTTEDDAMRADNANLEKLLNAMMDAYARATKLGEAEKHPSVATWKARFSQIYTFLKSSDAGMNEYLDKVLTTTMPDPSTF